MAIHPELACDLDGVDLHPLQVVVRGVVLRFDGARQRLDGSHVQGGELFGVQLAVLEPPHVEGVGALQKEQRRQDEQPSRPAERVAHRCEGPGHRPCQQVVGIT